MAVEGLNRTLQESLITCLCHDDISGKVVANLVDPQLFEGEMRIIAERAIVFWRDRGEAPKAHTDDLVSDILEDKQNKKSQTYRRLLINMLQLSESVNSEYVIDQLRKFTRTQKLKTAILKSAQQLNSKQEHAIAEVEQIWNDLLRSRDIAFDPGMGLLEYEKVLAFLHNRSIEFDTGIKELDDRQFIPMRGAIMLMLGPTGRGKSWFLVNVGKRALMHRKRVLHVTLELSEEETIQRYYQAMFSITKRDAEVYTTSLKLDRHGHFMDIERELYKPEFTMSSKFVAEELNSRLQYGGARFENIIVKKFPMRSLSMDGLRAFVDNLEITEKFIPDMLILDYFGVMKTDEKNHRVSLGRAFEDFKGFCEERNMAGVTAQQINRMGALSESIDMTQISEDWSMTNTADMVGLYSSTDAEFERGLGRFYVGKARSELDRYGVLLTQNYAVGQFAINSLLLDKKYFEKLKEYRKEDGDEDEEDTRYGDDDE